MKTPGSSGELRRYAGVFIFESIMDKQRVLEALRTLQAELAGADLDESSRAALTQLTTDIQRHVEAGRSVQDESGEPLSGRLQDALLEFETEHPQITGAVNQAAAALANLGI
jgi:hypothetical protein